MYKILFQGDSITDCGRDKTNENPVARYGYGYVNLIASRLLCDYPDTIVYNRAINGNRASDMYGRWIENTLNVDCNILSILCGINDIGLGIRMNLGADAKKFRFLYDLMIQEALEKKPDLKLALCEPFLFKIEEDTPECCKDMVESWALWSEMLSERQEIVADLAKTYGAVWVPFAAEFEKALATAPAQHWSFDGIHVNNAGHELMARTWLRHVLPETISA